MTTIAATMSKSKTICDFFIPPGRLFAGNKH